MPRDWDRNKAMDQIQAGLRAQIDDPILKEGSFNNTYFDGITTDE
jgi:hypothetical protein